MAQPRNGYENHSSIYGKKSILRRVQSIRKYVTVLIKPKWEGYAETVQ